MCTKSMMSEIRKKQSLIRAQAMVHKYYPTVTLQRVCEIHHQSVSCYISTKHLATGLSMSGSMMDPGLFLLFKMSPRTPQIVLRVHLLALDIGSFEGSHGNLCIVGESVCDMRTSWQCFS